LYFFFENIISLLSTLIKRQAFFEKRQVRHDLLIAGLESGVFRKVCRGDIFSVQKNQFRKP
jgi:hypothetical protein